MIVIETKYSKRENTLKKYPNERERSTTYLPSKQYFFSDSNYWLNLLIRDLMAPLLRAKTLHNSSIVSPLE